MSNVHPIKEPPDEPPDEPVTADDAIRRGYYAIIQEATTHQLRQMCYGLRTGKLPRIVDDAGRPL